VGKIIVKQGAVLESFEVFLEYNDLLIVTRRIAYFFTELYEASEVPRAVALLF